MLTSSVMFPVVQITGPILLGVCVVIGDKFPRYKNLNLRFGLHFSIVGRKVMTVSAGNVTPSSTNLYWRGPGGGDISSGNCHTRKMPKWVIFCWNGSYTCFY